jgi:hypothetical protein
MVPMNVIWHLTMKGRMARGDLSKRFTELFFSAVKKMLFVKK